MSVTVGQVTALTVITRITPGKVGRLKAALDAIRTSPESPLRRINTIHYARWVIIDEGTRLLFTSNFDGTLDDYLADFVREAEKGLNAIWGNCDDYPGANPLQPFIDYVRAREIDATLFYANYPDTTVKQVQRALRIQQKFDDFLDEF